MHKAFDLWLENLLKAGDLMEGIYRVPGQKCPWCGRQLSGVAGVGTDEAPDPGSVTMCAYCSRWLAFGDNLQLRRATANDLAEADPGELAECAAQVRAFQAARAVLS